MLEPLLGSTSAERVLIFILARNEGYAREIARFYKTDLTPIQKQLERLERGSNLVSLKVGRTRLYEFNPRYAFIKELRNLLQKTITFYSREDRERLLMVRILPEEKDR